MAIFVGLKQTAGHYQIKDEKTGAIEREGDYHNFMLHYIDDAETSAENLLDCTNYETFTAKIKADDVNGVFGCTVNDSFQFSDWYMKPIEIFFNRKGNVTLVRLIDDKPSNKKAAQ